MKNSSILQMVIRIFGLIQLILGSLVWTGNADFLIMFHILTGSIFTVALFIITYQAYRAGVPTWLVLLTGIWALILPIWGLAQEKILPAPYILVSQISHVLCGIGAIGIAEMLSVKIRKTKAIS